MSECISDDWELDPDATAPDGVPILVWCVESNHTAYPLTVVKRTHQDIAPDYVTYRLLQVGSQAEDDGAGGDFTHWKRIAAPRSLR